MKGQPSRRQAVRPVPGAAELAELRAWLVRSRGDKSFGQMSEEACAAGHVVTERTLRRAVDGRVPTYRVVQAWAAGAGVDPSRGEELLTRVRVAREPRAREGSDAWRITTSAGLVRAMKRVRARAGQPTERELAARGGPRLPRSTLGAVLRGESHVTAELLQAFLSACGAPDTEAGALLAARERIGHPKDHSLGWYPCAAAERAYEDWEKERSRARYRASPSPTRTVTTRTGTKPCCAPADWVPARSPTTN
ncbi:hypothetical protein D1J63_00015 [Streptomyces sp. KPB2]|uniref:hypothetical protein n=1 Tax=Streptomyces sp. KPB2 TaxID=2305221 RepID=UPI000F6F081E|nr:hypothetical protein [Streptomyces sp. KPB2]AZM73515.1 hypothetical protein D1J63_00015 [Streptomyces sp. KPB2]